MRNTIGKIVLTATQRRDVGRKLEAFELSRQAQYARAKQRTRLKQAGIRKAKALLKKKGW